MNIFIKKLNRDSPISEVKQAIISGLTDYDKKLPRNNYRISHFIDSANKFESIAIKTSIKKALAETYIINNNNKFDLPPINQIAKKLIKE